MAQFTGTKAVIWGCRPIPENIIGLPSGQGVRVRFRIRNNDAMRVFIRTNDGNTGHYILIADTMAGPWYLEPQGANASHQQPLKPYQPQYKDHLKLISNL